MAIHYYQNNKDKTVVIGGDHHSQELLDSIERHLKTRSQKYERALFNEENKDYISQSISVAEIVSQKPETYCGILVCNSGFGVTTVANKFPNVFAARCDNVQQANDSRRTNYSNLLTLGVVHLDHSVLAGVIDTWLETEFDVSNKNIERLNRLFKLSK